MMCMSTVNNQSGMLNDFLEEEDGIECKFQADRIGISSPFRYARGFALTLMVAAYLGQQVNVEASHLSSLLVSFSDETVLNGTWVVIYAFLVKAVLTYPLSLFLDWIGDLRDTTMAVTKVASTDTLSRLRSTVSMQSMRILSFAGRGGHQELRTKAISAKEPFMSVDEISDLTLLDVKDLFRYAVESGQCQFDREFFLSNLSNQARNAVDAIDTTVAFSRGSPYIQSDKTDGIDSLSLAAAIRIFAEWRNVRLVPNESDRRYVFGMNMARRDLLQNVEKIEAASHVWLSFQESKASSSNLTSPTIRELLRFEVIQKRHPRLPRLADKSGASALLWAVRQLKYQTALFSNSIQVPVAFPTSKAAVTAAYNAVYDEYQGFFVKQIFQSSFEAAPEAQVILQHMSARKHRETIKHESFLIEDLTDGDDEDCWIQLPVDQDVLEPTKPHEPRPVGQLGSLRSFVGQCMGIHVRGSPTRNAMHASPSMLNAPSLPVSAAEDELTTFISTMQPFLAALDTLMQDFNMNDPTKV